MTDMEKRPVRTARHRRAARLIAALAIGLVATSFLPGPARSAEEFVNGSGQSYAQIYRVGPTAGRLSLAPIFGLSLADYLNTVGRGEVKVADWAGIGVAERALPDNTPALKVNSTQKDSEKGVTEIVAGQSDGATGGGFAEMYARATDAPLGESRFRLNSMSIPGVLEARDSESHTITGCQGRRPRVDRHDRDRPPRHRRDGNAQGIALGDDPANRRARRPSPGSSRSRGCPSAAFRSRSRADRPTYSPSSVRSTPRSRRPASRFRSRSSRSAADRPASRRFRSTSSTRRSVASSSRRSSSRSDQLASRSSTCSSISRSSSSS